MSQLTSIQWGDSTVNPTMGCNGCELFPSPAAVLQKIDDAVMACGAKVSSRTLLTEMIQHHFQKIKDPEHGHRNTVTTTNIWHFREPLSDAISLQHGPEAGRAVLAAIQTSITCYAAKLHLNRGANILRPDRKTKKGYAPTFEQLTNFEGRVAAAAGWKDLLGSKCPDAPWKDDLARLIFLSDMGDSHSSKSKRQFDFLEREVIEPATSEKGLRHLWLWLTKRPLHMRDFATRIDGLPANFCGMTTVTGPETLYRVDDLRQVAASSRGLSIEPLWDRIPPKDLNLRGIDWVILGGESGSGKLTRPFHVEWAEELHAHCSKHGVAFFLKQLGRNPVVAGKPIRLADPHGGNWDEWPRHLRVREFPAYFHLYRSGEKTKSKALRPS